VLGGIGLYAWEGMFYLGPYPKSQLSQPQNYWGVEVPGKKKLRKGKYSRRKKETRATVYSRKFGSQNHKERPKGKLKTWRVFLLSARNGIMNN